ERGELKPSVYGVKHVLDKVREKSSSGGMFTAISDFVLENEGVVYGVVFDKAFKVCHSGAKTYEDRDKMCSSKYVQSDIGKIFTDVKQDLDDEKYVVFSGTPCQVAGLISFLGGKHENLLTCDLICHGVCSPLLWDDYLKYLEKTYKSKILSYNFRHRWKGLNVFCKFENGKVLDNSEGLLKYPRLFYSNMALRPSCHNCYFSNVERCSDITIGDFWGIEKVMPEFEDEIGVSLVFVNTEKGEKVFENLRSNLIVRELDIKNSLQDSLQRPTAKPEMRESFWRDYRDKGFKYVSKKYTDTGILCKTKKFLGRVKRAVIK
ncbi:MAG: Coenzyme F420 hydrogenase/dehydrogenase, beta subunit C-terminal domain, partial [Oscillospiraceae bacterium]